MIYDMVQSGTVTMEDASKIAQRLVGFGFLTIGGNSLKEFIENIIKKFSN
jgi:hypothetical protein